MFKNIMQAIRSGIQRLQRRWSAWLSAKWNALSLRRQKWLLAVFCAALGTACLFIITNGLLVPGRGLPVLHPITFPRHVIPYTPPHATHLPVQEGAFQVQVRLFGLYLDSLQASPAGRKIYDSLAAARPGLLDTLQKLETFYHLK